MKIRLIILIISLVKTIFAENDLLKINDYRNRTVIVNLFEWKWVDIGRECERFLGPKGFAGVQISPPQEHAVIDTPFRPWWQRYQPVSYKLISRSGNEQELIVMIKRCKAAGVRVYVDLVLNHMSALSGIGSAGSRFDGATRNFSAVPYSFENFNDNICTSKTGVIDAGSWNDPYQVRNCRLLNLPDLATGSDYVRDKLSNYVDFLIGIGVSGFRIDAAKHMWPVDLINITRKYFNKESKLEFIGLNKQPFIYQEVYDDGSGAVRYNEYTDIGLVTEFRYSYALNDVIRKTNNQKLKYLSNFGTSWNFMPSEEALVFIDNHDTQRDGIVLSFREQRKYKIANAFMLAWPYGYVRLMSSYNFSIGDRDQGPPTTRDGQTLNVRIKKNGLCASGWICEHRWKQITNMVEFRNIAGNEPVQNWWDNDNNQIAFSRGNKTFIAINNDDTDMDVTLQTGLPGGTYCDIISGDKVAELCTGRIINVNDDGTLKISIKYFEADPVIAIHINSQFKNTKEK